MGEITWSISPDNIGGVAIENRNNGEFNFPPNNSESPMDFTISYTNGDCNQTIGYTLPGCKKPYQDFEIEVLYETPIVCENGSNCVYIRLKEGEIPRDKRNSVLSWVLNTPIQVTGQFLLSDLSNGDAKQIRLGNVPCGSFSFEWEIVGCKNGSVELESDGLCYNFSGGTIMVATKEDSADSCHHLGYGIQSIDIKYRLVRKNGNNYEPLTEYDYLKINNVTAGGGTRYAGETITYCNGGEITVPSKYPNIDIPYNGEPATVVCDCKHIYHIITTATTVNNFNDEINEINFDGFTINDVYFDLKINKSEIFLRNDFTKNQTDFSECCGHHNMLSHVKNEDELSTDFIIDNNEREYHYISIKNIRAFSKKNIIIRIWPNTIYSS